MANEMREVGVRPRAAENETRWLRVLRHRLLMSLSLPLLQLMRMLLPPLLLLLWLMLKKRDGEGAGRRR